MTPTPRYNAAEIGQNKAIAILVGSVVLGFAGYIIGTGVFNILAGWAGAIIGVIIAVVTAIKWFRLVAELNNFSLTGDQFASQRGVVFRHRVSMSLAGATQIELTMQGRSHPRRIIVRWDNTKEAFVATAGEIECLQQYATSHNIPWMKPRI